MGVTSKLRSKPVENGTRLAYANGDRKLYEKDACPAGYDEHVWSLAILFRDQAEERGWPMATGLPIIATEIYEKALTDPSAAAILCIDSLGEGGPTAEDILLLLEDTIYYYYNYYSSNTPPTITDYISSWYLLKSVVEERRENYILKTTGARVVQSSEIKPDRRSDWEKERARIIFSVADEETMNKRLEDFINEFKGEIDGE